jgi:hypothetical protein
MCLYLACYEMFVGLLGGGGYAQVVQIYLATRLWSDELCVWLIGCLIIYRICIRSRCRVSSSVRMQIWVVPR